MPYLVTYGECMISCGVQQGQEQTSLPFEPMTLTFRDLHYLVPLPPQQADSPNAVIGENGQKELELLKGINGAFRCLAYRRNILFNFITACFSGRLHSPKNSLRLCRHRE